jgi:hypothetical protein
LHFGAIIIWVKSNLIIEKITGFLNENGYTKIKALKFNRDVGKKEIIEKRS